MGEQIFGGLDEAHGVRQFRVSLERGFVLPFRMNRELQRIVQRLEDVEGETTGLGATGRDHAQDFLAEFSRHAGARFEANDKVNGQASSRRTSMPLWELTAARAAVILEADIE